MLSLKHPASIAVRWARRPAFCFLLGCAGFSLSGTAHSETAPPAPSIAPTSRALPFYIEGISVTPQNLPGDINFPHATDKDLGVRVEIFTRNRARLGGTNSFHCHAVRFDGETPQKLAQDGLWSWQDTPPAWNEDETEMPPGGLTVWRFNTRNSQWGLGRNFPVTVVDWQRIAQSEWNLSLNPQGVWFSSIVFTSHDGNPIPDSLTMHVANESAGPVQFIGFRLFLPATNTSYRVLYPQPAGTNAVKYPADGRIQPGDKGCYQAQVGRLPLTYAAVQAIFADAGNQQFAIWAHLRVKRETFDIGGGWVQEADLPATPMVLEPFLKTLQRMHVNTANFVTIPGYTDKAGPESLQMRYPLKRFGKLEPVAAYEQDSMLPFVHAIEFLGEPQYEGGTPRPPQVVWQALQPYAKTRLSTTVTLSDASAWRQYAGLSDYPNFDAYRVCAPATDDWLAYDRWGEKRIAWGAPLETIGALCRSLRELSRPKPIACWSQGPHAGWDALGGRKRTSPTPDEIRMQAYHALSSRVTSLYWFNLNLKSLVQFRDTIDEITRIGREIGMLSDFYVEGDAYRYRRAQKDGKPDWDLASIASPKGAVLFALDLDYEPDRGDKVFEFKHRRDCRFYFELPAYLRAPVDVFRVDAEGVYEVKWQNTATGVAIDDRQSKTAIYVAAPSRETKSNIERKRLSAIAFEQAVNFDPARRGKDFDQLKAGLGLK
jgi:hypothetical protein